MIKLVVIIMDTTILAITAANLVSIRLLECAIIVKVLSLLLVKHVPKTNVSHVKKGMFIIYYLASVSLIV